MRMMLIALAALIAGCEHMQSVSLPDGKSGYEVDCSRGFRRSWANCMNQAAQVCGGKYTIISQNGESPGGMILPAGNSFLIANANHRKMIFECAKP